MGPKKGDAAAAKAAAKAKQEKRQQSADDRTFGLKNKNKSKAVQRYVQEVQQGVSAKSHKSARLEAEAPSAKKKREAEKARQAELDELFAVAIKQPKAPPGVDPKSIVCEYYRKGKCSKGFKCKYSHDLAVERKTAKASIYEDEKEGDNMEDWDQEKLESVINSKHEGDNKNRPTDIICKHFLDAVETKAYGWFWVCPGGGKECKYRHALPKGYVLQSQIKALQAEAKANMKSLEEEIEEERLKLDASTPVDESVFREWKLKKLEKKKAKQDEERAVRQKSAIMTGREMFESEGFVAVDDDAAGGGADYTREDDFEAEWKKVQAESEANQANAKAGVVDLGADDLAMLADDDDELDEADLDDDMNDEDLAAIEKGIQGM